MAQVETFVREYRVAASSLLEALEKIEVMKRQALALDYPTTLADEFANNVDLAAQNPDIEAADLIAATQAVDAIWALLNANDYVEAAKLYKMRI